MAPEAAPIGGTSPSAWTRLKRQQRHTEAEDPHKGRQQARACPEVHRQDHGRAAQEGDGLWDRLAAKSRITKSYGFVQPLVVVVLDEASEGRGLARGTSSPAGMRPDS